MYSVDLDIRGRSCLVIGGGVVALRKVRRLLEEGAAITVTAPKVCRELTELAEKRDIRWHRRRFDGKVLGEYGLVVTATGSREVAEAVSRQARERYFLYNSADFPELGNCHVPAKVRRDGVSVTVSTEGRSPSAAKYVLRQIQEQWQPFWGEWARHTAAWRKEWKETVPDERVRKRLWNLVGSPAVTKLAKQGKWDEAEELLRHEIGRSGAES